MIVIIQNDMLFVVWIIIICNVDNVKRIVKLMIMIWFILCYVIIILIRFNTMFSSFISLSLINYVMMLWF